MNDKKNQFDDKALLFGIIAENFSKCLALTDKCLFVFHDGIENMEKPVFSIIPYNDIVCLKSIQTSNSFNMIVYTKDDYKECQTTYNSVTKNLDGNGIAITNERFFPAGIISRIYGFLGFVLEEKVCS